MIAIHFKYLILRIFRCWIILLSFNSRKSNALLYLSIHRTYVLYTYNDLSNYYSNNYCLHVLELDRKIETTFNNNNKNWYDSKRWNNVLIKLLLKGLACTNIKQTKITIQTENTFTIPSKYIGFCIFIEYIEGKQCQSIIIILFFYLKHVFMCRSHIFHSFTKNIIFLLLNCGFWYCFLCYSTHISVLSKICILFSGMMWYIALCFCFGIFFRREKA